MVQAIRRMYIERPDPGELTSIRRTAKVVKAFCDGFGLTTREVATMSGITMPGARYLLNAISNVVEIYEDDEGVWQLCVMRELA